VVVLGQDRLDVRRERCEVALVEDRLDELSRTGLDDTCSARKKKTTPTYRFRSSFRASGFTPTRLRSMRDMVSSRKMTTSCPKNLSRHGLLARWSLGIFDRKRLVNDESRGFRGSSELTARSKGPGTKTKCVRRVMRV
jgi:hypothetical protein